MAESVTGFAASRANGPGNGPGNRQSAPVSTYRLQLRDSFGFGQAAEQAGYLAALGVTHVYLSPILQANPGSPHGYDLVDHSRVSTDLGGEPAFREMADEFHPVSYTHLTLPTIYSV